MLQLLQHRKGEMPSKYKVKITGLDRTRSAVKTMVIFYLVVSFNFSSSLCTSSSIVA